MNTILLQAEDQLFEIDKGQLAQSEYLTALTERWNHEDKAAIKIECGKEVFTHVIEILKDPYYTIPDLVYERVIDKLQYYGIDYVPKCVFDRDLCKVVQQGLKRNRMLKQLTDCTRKKEFHIQYKKLNTENLQLKKPGGKDMTNTRFRTYDLNVILQTCELEERDRNELKELISIMSYLDVKFRFDVNSVLAVTIYPNSNLFFYLDQTPNRSLKN